VLQELLLEAGLAWVYPLYCPDCANWYAILLLRRVFSMKFSSKK
jgi:hypothetical protein